MFSRDIAPLATSLKSEDNASSSFKGAARDNAVVLGKKKSLWILTKALPLLANASRRR